MQRRLAQVTRVILDGQGWKKLANPVVARGKTAWPSKVAEKERYGVRYDYDGEIKLDGVVHHKFQMQPNAGAVPAAVKKWLRKAKGGTHAVMANVYVRKGGGKKAVKEALEQANKGIAGV